MILIMNSNGIQPFRTFADRGAMPVPFRSSQPIDEEAAWRQLEGRDKSASFVYGVTTTGVFCRPGCGSRAPLRDNTRFFASAAEASAAGFRACLRCKPEEPAKEPAVARMCALLERHPERAVRLAELGRLIGMSPFTAQKMFKQAMGVSPAQYQRALRGSALRRELRKGASVTEAIYEAGYGSSSRAYEQGPLGMTPGRFAAGGRGEKIGFAVAECSGALPGLGWMVIAGTERGLCWLALGGSAEEVEASVRREFPAAEVYADAGLAGTIEAVLQRVAGAEAGGKAGADLPLDLRGTAFQLRVWQALREIPPGETRSYSQLAREMGKPEATRAVARACALNRVSILVPCHRVVGVSGSLTGYRWGVERKRRLLDAEAGRG